MELPWSEDPETSKAAVKAIEDIINTDDTLARYKLALSLIEGFAAYLSGDKHSRFSMVCAQAAQDPILFKEMKNCS